MTSDGVGTFFALTYFIGVIVSVSVLRWRAGTGFWYGLRVFGPNGFGPVWTGTVIVCSMAWPVTLAVWILRGRPEPRIVFNEKALERQRRAGVSDNRS